MNKPSRRSGSRIAFIVIWAVLVMSLTALAGILLSRLSPDTAQVSVIDDGAEVLFASPDVQTLLRQQCVSVNWQVQGAQAVMLNGTPVDASGTAESCGTSRPTLTVTYENGRSRDYRLTRTVFFEQAAVRLLLAVFAVALGALAHLTGRLDGFYHWAGNAIARRAPSLMAEWRELSPLFRLNLHELTQIQRIALIAIMLIGLIVRLGYLSVPMAGDESDTFAQFVSVPLARGLSHYPYPNNHLFHTLLAHISTQLFGYEPWVIRLPAFLAGLLALPLTYLLGRRWFNRNTGLLAMGFMCGSLWLIGYSVEARGYTITVVLYLALALLATHLAHQPNRLGWILFAVLGALSLWTVPTMVYGLAPLVVWLGLQIISGNAGPVRNTLLKGFVASLVLMGLLTVLLYMPVFIASGVDRVIGNKYVTSLGWRRTVTGMPVYVQGLWADWTRDVPLVLTYVLMIGFIAGLVRQIVAWRQRLPLVLFIMLLVPVMMVAQRVHPFYRVYVFALPAFFLTVSYGCDLLFRGLPKRAGAIVASLAAVTIAAWMSLQVVSNDTVYLRPHMLDPQSDPQRIVRDFGPRLYTDELLYVWPIDRHFRYYMVYEGFEETQARDNNNQNANGLYIVVPGWATIDLVVVDSALDLTGYTVPERVAEYPYASVYYTTRRPTNTAE